MRKFILAAIMLLAIVVPVTANDKVTICHAAGLEGTTKFVTLTISRNAVFKDQGGHFFENGTPQAGHEQDYLGPCTTDATPTPTPTPTPSVVPTPTPTVEPTPTPPLEEENEPDMPDTAMDH